jgi:sec-independent protein translocase protein TatB
VFNFSGSEIVFLLLLALIVLGPEKLPEAVRRFGKTYGEFKKMTTGFQTELKSALDEPMREMRETADAFKKAASFDMNADEDDSEAKPPVVAEAKAQPETKPAPARAPAATESPATFSAAPPMRPLPAEQSTTTEQHDASPAAEPDADSAAEPPPARTGLDAVVVRDAPVARSSAAALRRGTQPGAAPGAADDPPAADTPADVQPVDGDQGAASA